jgi:hypothetical protein
MSTSSVPHVLPQPLKGTPSHVPLICVHSPEHDLSRQQQ